MWYRQEKNSVFYVDSDYESLNASNKMESEVRSLKRELEQTREALRLATKRCRELVCELDNRVAGHDSERALRDQQLSRILRALLVVEGRLRQEQKSIRQLLREKDNVIRNQQLEIAKLRRYTKNYIKCKRDNKVCKRNLVGGTEDEVLGDSTPVKIAYDESSAVCEVRIENGVVSDRNFCGNARTEIKLGCELKSEREKVVGRENLETRNEVDDEAKNEATVRTNSLNKDISILKREIIDRLNDDDSGQGNHGRVFVRKNHSFAESDVSKSSLTSGETTDLSTTTTEDGDGVGSSPSLVSTEGFCEGESTDVSPGSTLNKPSNRCIVETKKDVNLSSDEDGIEEALRKRTRLGIVRGKTSGTKMARVTKTRISIDRRDLGSMRDDSNDDDGMDCRFVSDEEEPLYENTTRLTNNGKDDFGEKKLLTRSHVVCAESARLQAELAESKVDGKVKGGRVDHHHHHHHHHRGEEMNGNWYGDRDEDRSNEEVYRRSRGDSKHKSVLECVNRILLREMEEEENNQLLSMTGRQLKHRGRIVRFEPPKLSDIESVGSEMERRNDQESKDAKEIGDSSFEDREEDEDRSRIEDEEEDEEDRKDSVRTTRREGTEDSKGGEDGEEGKNAYKGEKAMPIVVIEPPRNRIEEEKNGSSRSRKEAKNSESVVIVTVPCPGPASSGPGSVSSGPVAKRTEQMEERTCLRMSSKGLTIPRRSMDYDQGVVEEESTRSPGRTKTPPALPPKPNYKNTSLILKKIPSPSFLINETRKRRHVVVESVEELKPRTLFSNATTIPSTARKFSFDDKLSSRTSDEDRGSFAGTRFQDRRSASFQSRGDDLAEIYEGLGHGTISPKVTHIVRHFEEFKIGEADEDRASSHRGEHRGKTMIRISGRNASNDHLRSVIREEDKDPGIEYDQDDIRQNFEEFRLEDCDLFNDNDNEQEEEEEDEERETAVEVVVVVEEDKEEVEEDEVDPSRAEADGSERLTDPSLVTTAWIPVEPTVIVKTKSTVPQESSSGSADTFSSNSVGGGGGGYDHFLEATGLSTKSILMTPSRLLSNHKSMLKPKDVKYKNKIKATAILEKHGVTITGPNHTTHTRVKRWTGPFV